MCGGGVVAGRWREVVALRSRLVAESARRGGMVSVGLSEAAGADLADRRFGGVSIAGRVNGPASVVVSGDVEALAVGGRVVGGARGVASAGAGGLCVAFCAMQVLEESLGAAVGWRSGFGGAGQVPFYPPVTGGTWIPRCWMAGIGLPICGERCGLTRRWGSA